MDTNDVLWKIALSMIDGMGPVTTSRLIAEFERPQEVFAATPSALKKVDGVQPAVVNQILSRKVLDEAALEVDFIEKNEIRAVLVTENDYPRRLKQCADAPAILYMKGQFNPDQRRVLGIVGTRKATSFGKEICSKIIEELSVENILIVSGMAYGIDVCAHREAVKHKLPTAAVFAHGLDLIYPTAHRPLAEEMLAHGGWVTEFRSRTPMDKNYFPRRNRIVAGLCDAVLVVESDKKGGSLITADIANSYSREVLAVPGKPTDLRSVGCNWLIKTNRAALVESGADVLRLLDWQSAGPKQVTQQLTAFPALSEEELELARCLQESGPVSLDALSDIAGKPTRDVSYLLLNLELEGVVKALPGKRYRLTKPLASYA